MPLTEEIRNIYKINKNIVETYDKIMVYSSCTTVVFSDTYNPSKNLRISLFFTVVDCWIKAAKTNKKIF